MTVKEIRDAIKDFPDTMEVVLSSDEEGNNFRKLDGIETFVLEEDGSLMEPVYDEEDDYYLCDDKKNSLVLYP